MVGSLVALQYFFQKHHLSAHYVVVPLLQVHRLCYSDEASLSSFQITMNLFESLGIFVEVLTGLPLCHIISLFPADYVPHVLGDIKQSSLLCRYVAEQRVVKYLFKLLVNVHCYILFRSSYCCRLSPSSLAHMRFSIRSPLRCGSRPCSAIHASSSATCLSFLSAAVGAGAFGRTSSNRGSSNTSNNSFGHSISFLVFQPFISHIPVLPSFLPSGFSASDRRQPFLSPLGRGRRLVEYFLHVLLRMP